jgi:hypothetical protein
MQKVLFLFPHFIGHLNRSLLFAEKHRAKGHEVIYVISAKHSFPFSYPCLFWDRGRLGSLVRKSIKESWSWEKTLTEVNKSKDILRGIIEEVNPDLVYFDDFCAADLLLVWELVDMSKISILSPSFPAQKSTDIPPQQRFSLRGRNEPKEWEKLETECFEPVVTKKVRDLMVLISEEMRLPERFAIWNFFESIPMFSNLTKYYCVPESFDFPGQKLMPWESYAGWSVRLDRDEQIDPAVAFIMKKAKSREGNKLIYVSLGTVVLDFVPTGVLIEFFENIIAIGQDNPNWYFFVHVPEVVAAIIRPKSINVHIRTFLPQLFLLRRADLSLSHGGTNSVAEAILLGVPLLVFPSIGFLDTKGVCARVVYHRLGRAATLDTPTDDLCRIIKKMVEEGDH